jgi:hypothetical protein
MRRFLLVMAVVVTTTFGASTADAQGIGEVGYLGAPGQRPMSAYDAAPAYGTWQDAVSGHQHGSGGWQWLRDGMPADHMTVIPGNQWTQRVYGCSVRDYFVC